MRVGDLPEPVQAHTCPDGERRLGDELDCRECRAALLTAFRDPPDHQAEFFRQAGQPHLFPGPEHSRTVPLSHQPVPSVHPHPDRPGGTWVVACPCGWSRSGGYARDGVGELTSQRLAQAYADEHLRNPLADPYHDLFTHVSESGTWMISCSCGFRALGHWGSGGHPLATYEQASAYVERRKRDHLKGAEDQ